MHFKSRLQVVLILCLISWLALVARLFQLQVLRADQYRASAEQRRMIGRRLLAPIRGRILDRRGVELARDEPAWGIAVDYRLLRGDRAFIEGLARRMRKDLDLGPPPGGFDEALARVVHEIDRLWTILGEWGGPEFVQQRREAIVKQVEEWRWNYIVRQDLTPKGNDALIREERECHPVIDGLSKGDELHVRSWQQEHFDFLMRAGAVRISDSTRREYPDGLAFAHILGQLGEVSAGDMRKRPFHGRDDHVDWGGYRLGDLCGRSGVERLAEPRLRGLRGRLLEFIDERPPERLEPVHGLDVPLTVDARLQWRVHDLLQQSIERFNEELGRRQIPGGSVVVLDVASREVLAMVSYPGYDPNAFRTLYQELREDVIGLPLRHRAISASYAPGSIVKPVTIAAAHDAELIALDTLQECSGFLNPSNTRSFRCWRPAGSATPKQHGLVNSEGAIRGSCNVFCFKMGNRLCDRFGGARGGVSWLCDWLGRFGVGRSSGIGLPEEASGILPTPERLQRLRRQGPLVADARNYAIGQGEVQVTPLQAANIVATLASGEFRPVTLLRDDVRPEGQPLPVGDGVWQAIRRGMYGVVNSADGTAPRARLQHPRFCLCGKSGSAETPRWGIRYLVQFPSGSMDVVASSVWEARQRCLDELRRCLDKPGEPCVEDIETLTVDDLQAECTARFPEQPPEAGRKYSHAWFVAFLQATTSRQHPDWSVESPLAIAVLLEFGGSGGSVAGPVCRDVADLIVNEFPEYVEPDEEAAAPQP